MRIGILGGSFDPIHYGHLYMARKAKKEYHLDEIWLIPAGHSPNKDEQQMTDALERFKMCQLAVESEEGMKVSTIEIDSYEKSYTYRTLQKLCTQYPEYEFYFIMGADSLDYFDHWYHPEMICALSKILVVNRDDFTEADLNHKIERIQKKFQADIQLVHCEKWDISSHEIRDLLRQGSDVSQHLPASVRKYITEHGLYQRNIL
jgi:nicotinate-nucleotide adenylyltransferase